MKEWRATYAREDQAVTKPQQPTPGPDASRPTDPGGAQPQEDPDAGSSAYEGATPAYPNATSPQQPLTTTTDTPPADPAPGTQPAVADLEPGPDDATIIAPPAAAVAAPEANGTEISGDDPFGINEPITADYDDPFGINEPAEAATDLGEGGTVIRPAPDADTVLEAPTQDYQAISAEPQSPADDLFRSSDEPAKPDQTAVLSAPENARLRREERAAARERSLGRVKTTEEEPEPAPVTLFTTPSTYRAFPSFGFLLLRLVVAAVLGVRAWRHWAELTLTRQVWDTSLLRHGTLMGWITIGVEIGVAVLLLLGLGTRIAGFLLLAYAAVLLVFLDWGAANIIQRGYFGFLGDLDLVLAVLGLFLFTAGGGRIGFDGSIHTSRIRRKNDRLIA